MSLQDKQKWDKKYENKPQLLESRDSSEYIKKYAKDMPGKQAMDIACGAGRNTLYLAKQGFKVDAIDIAEEALRALDRFADKEGVSDKITTIQADLESYVFKEEHYHLIVMTNYLDRNLLEKLKPALKKDALFIIETYMQDETNEKEIQSPQNLLEKEELKYIFKEGFEILDYKEFKNEAHEMYVMKKQMIVVRKVLSF